jgi:NAD(P)H-hydrate epimerase
VQTDRFAALEALQQSYAGTIVLKGSGALVAGGGIPVGLCAQGNPGMASAGMGDVLSGLAGALLARGVQCHRAARAAVLLHAMAADMEADARGEVGLKAIDLLVSMRQILNRELGGE